MHRKSHRARISAVIVLVAFGVPVASCSLFVTLDGLSNAPSDASASTTDAPATSDAPSEVTDASVNDGAHEASAPSCGGRPGVGATMVQVLDAGFCIDTTEVSLDQYDAFYMANPTPTSAECAWKTGYTPPPSHGSNAIGNVDWCDANEYCAWAGKRLCGAVGGGVLDLSNSLTDESEWQFTCTHGGQPQWVWPYGDGAAPDPSVCLYADSPGNPTGSRPIASNPACTGPAGIFDISGNVWEWENACDRTAGVDAAAADCNLRGGGFLRVSSSWGACLEVPGGWARDSHVADTGIRCCSDYK
jgi:formylglycine-generating enzyme required for sulfatase activity